MRIAEISVSERQDGIALKTIQSVLRKQNRLIVLTGVLWPEDDQWVAQCIELDIATSGKTADDAHEELVDAIAAYVNTLDELGERERIFARAGIAMYELPPDDFRPPPIPMELASRDGAQIRPVRLPI